MYNYEEFKQWLFSDEGSRIFIRTRDRILEHLRKNGCIRFQEALAGSGINDSWKQIAVVDRMVELHDLCCVTPEAATQYRVYVDGGS